MNNKNQIQEKSITENSEPFNTRRKLVKGSAIAVPMVMTLRSGSALAASSSNHCIAQNQLFAQDRLVAGELPEFRDSSTNSVETFFRKEVTSSQLIRIKSVTVGADTFWIYDKNADSSLNTTVIYNYSLPINSSQWLDTATPQKNYVSQLSVDTQPIAVYDSEATGPGTPGEAIAITGERFTEGGFNYVLDNTQTGIRYGLIMTDSFGNVILDQFSNPRIGRLVNSGTLASMHLTTSCMTSLAP